MHTCAGRRLPALPVTLAPARGTVDGAGQVGSEARGQGQASLDREEEAGSEQRPNELPLSYWQRQFEFAVPRPRNCPFCARWAEPLPPSVWKWAAPPSIEGGCGKHGSQDQCNGQD